MKLEQIKTPVSAVGGVGPQLSKSLARLNIFTVGDLLNHFPKDYDDKSKKVYLKDFAKAKKVHTVAKVLGHEWFGFGKMRTLKIIINDGTATAQLICFNRQFLEKMILPGMIVNVSGQFFVKYNSLQSSSFDVSKFKQNVACDDLKQLIELMPEDSSVLPVYRLTEGVTQKQMSKIIKNAINQYGHGIEDEIPSEFISKYKLVSKQQAIFMIHNFIASENTKVNLTSQQLGNYLVANTINSMEAANLEGFKVVSEANNNQLWRFTAGSDANTYYIESVANPGYYLSINSNTS